MVSAKEAFTDAYRSYRIQQGDDASFLPNPIGRSTGLAARKRRKTDPPAVEVDSGGGFFVEEKEEEQHSLQAEEENQEDNDDANMPHYIPLSSIPDALATLALPSNDVFVLNLFAQTATYIQSDTRRRKRPVGSEGGTGRDEKMVNLRDFKRVVEVLLDADTGRQANSSDDDKEEEEEEEAMDNVPSSRKRPIRAAASTANERRQKQIQDEKIEAESTSSDEDEFHSIELAAAGGDEEEEAYEEEEQQASSRSKVKDTARGTGKGPNKKSSQKSAAFGGIRRNRKQSKRIDDTTATDEEDEEDEGHLNATQKRTVHAAFTLFTNKLRELKGEPLDEQPRLGKDDLKLLVAHVGEKISDKDVEEMIEEGLRFFAKASSRDITKQTARLKREAAAGRSTARGEVNRSQTVGIDEFAGILLKGRMI